MYRDKTIWLIGAGSDIATAFLKQYHGKFGTIVLAGRNTAMLKKTAHKFQIRHCYVYSLDLCAPQSIRAFLTVAPSPDIVINFAGHIQYGKKSENTSFANIETTFRVNTLGAVEIFEFVAAQMKEKRSGTIVNLSSLAADRGKASNRIYCAGKAAVSNYMQGLAQACDSYGVCIVDIKLGRVKTKMLKSSPHKCSVFAINAKKAADLVFKSVCATNSGVKYQPVWGTIIRIYRAIPDTVYNRLSL